MSFILSGSGVITDPANAPIDITANSAGPYLPGVAYTWNITNLDDYTTYTLTTTNGTIVRSSATLTYTPASGGAGGWTMNGRAINLTIATIGAFISTSQVSNTVLFTAENSANSTINVGGWSSNTYLGSYTGVVAQYTSSGTRNWIRYILDFFCIIGAVKLASDNSTFVGIRDTTNTRGYIMKITSSGTVAFSQFFDNCSITGVAVDSSDNVIVGGSTSGVLFLAKFNSSGTLQWQRTDSGVGGDIRGMVADSSGNIFFATGTGSNCYIAKVNSSGTLQWVSRLSSSNMYGNAITLDSSGNVIVCGEAITTDYLGWVAKLNSSGVLQWQRQFLNSAFYGVAVDSSDNIYASGVNTTGSPTGNNTVAKWDSSGTLQWQRRVAYGLSQQTQNTISVSGSSFYLSNSGYTAVYFVLGQNRFPTDGSIPTFSIGSAPGSYAATSLTESAGTLTNPAGSFTLSASSLTLTSSTPQFGAFSSTSEVKQGV